MKRKRYGVMVLLVAMLFAIGCGDSKAGSITTGRYYNPQSETVSVENTEEKETQTTQTEEKEDEITTDLFLIMNNDMRSECLILEQMASGKQYMYYYSITTRFLDKYGNRTTVSCFEPGRVITIGQKDIQGKVVEVQLSDRVWEYPDVTKFSIDEEKGIFEIAGNNYSFEEGLFVNSDGNPEQLSDLTDMDELRVVGIGKKILSVSVTTGHGELQLSNTQLFEGSYIQIGNKIFAEVTSNMSLEIPEGTYTVAVANKGYGGSTEVEVKRGQKVTLDLDTLKGEGPQTGRILFAIDVAGAVLQIDGNVVDYSQPVELSYGVHTLTVTANAYDSYAKRLYVNSKEATIVISMTSTSGTTSGTTSSDTTSEGTTDNQTSSDGTGLAGSLAGSHSSNSSTGGTSSSTNIDEAELNAIVNELLGEEDEDSQSDYLSTLSEVLSALTSSSD